ncbi:MAG: tRNA (adenosine(37)-N6)-threonylcarbamoyltransferase complex dimerization subunit type 1 TsaB [Chloroflexota bacterium]
MRLLAIETSTLLGGVAIMDDGGLVAESRFNVKVTHSERLMADIDHVLRRSGLSIGEIDVFGLAAGPGSFTGLRVGLSTMKGIVYATRRPLVAVSTLEALAWNLPFCRHQVCPVLDARKREVYTSVYRWNDGRFSPVIGERVCSIDTLLAEIAERTVFLGEGARLYRGRIEACLGDKALFAAPQSLVPSAAHVACLCMERAGRRAFDDPLTLVPRYLRRSEAEVKSQESSAGR